jgi:hypothetical protein
MVLSPRLSAARTAWRLPAGSHLVIAIAERLNLATVTTLNRRDFTVIRPRHVKALTPIPE